MSLLSLSLLLLLLPLALTSPTPLLARATQVVATATGYCFKPAPWTQILSFFLTNYIARVATFKKTSGYEGFRDYTETAMSLFVPFVGISQAAATIARGSRFLGHDDVERALLAEALCVIVREGGWGPEHGEVIRGCRLTAGDDDLREKLRRRARRRRRHGRRSHSRDAPSRKPSRSRSRGERGKHRKQEFLGQPQLLPPHGYNDGDGDNGDSDSEDSYSPTTATLIVSLPDIETISSPKKYKIQGFYSLPPTYALALLQPGSQLQPLSQSSARKKDVVISNSYGVVKAFTGAVQIVSSLYTLYSANTDQVEVYGYAALGFTVLPYTIMSVLNTLANLVEASYDCLFLVRSDVMAEAEKREKGEFIGEVAELVPDSRDLEIATGAEFMDMLFTRAPTGVWHAEEVDDHDRVVVGGRRCRVHIPHDLGLYRPEDDPRAKIHIQSLGRTYRFSEASQARAAKFRKRAVLTIMVFSLITPYVVVGGLSRFKQAGSSVQERVFVAGWLVVGQVIGALNLVGDGVIGRERRKNKYWWTTLEWGIKRIVMVLGFAMAIGGFVVVGRQLRGFGFCVNV
jgi:hypothetical protein